MAYGAIEQAEYAEPERQSSWTDLEQAIKNGKPLNEITRLLDSGVPTTGWSPSPEGGALVTAVNAEREDIMSLLLDRGADINIVGGEYGTALAAATQGRILGPMFLLLDRGADINAVGDKYGTALATAAFGGKTVAVSRLLDRGADINMVGGEYGTALVAASLKGFGKTVKLLLDQGADINMVVGKYGTALVAAAISGFDSIIELLLDRGANVDMAVSEYGTALTTGASRGLDTIIDLLIDRGADINMVGGDHGTALAAAAAGGHVGTVQLLLDRGADTNVVSGKHGTALATAAFIGFPAVVELLLDRGVSINTVVSQYGTALAAAALEDSITTMSLLLDRGANINSVGGEYGTALAAAAFGGRVRAASLLLDRGANINAVGGIYGTALAAAALRSFDLVVHLLLDRGADINMVSGKYGTVLAEVAFVGVEDIVRLLLDRGADTNVVSGQYGTALTTAAFKGFDLIVELLLDRGADINMVGGDHGTALAAAAAGGYVGTVQLLLDRGADTNVVVSGKHGTALAIAAFNGFPVVVELLLDRGADINTPSDKYGTALAAAALGGRVGVVSLLLDRGANINTVDGVYGTALAAAAYKGFEEIVELLLDRGANINLGTSSKYGTAFAAAAHRAEKDILSLLLDRGADINTVCEKYGTALAAAAVGGKLDTVLLLLDWGAKINVVGGTYGTALAAASFAGVDDTVRLLLDRGADINVVGGKYGTALAAAASKGEISVVSLLLEHGADITHVSRPPFPMPYTASYHHNESVNDTLSSNSGFINIPSTAFCAGGSITPEQADVPCRRISEEVLLHSLATLVGLDEETRSKAKHQWIQNDIGYFIAHHFDFGLAYAAVRVAWKDFNKHSMDSSLIYIQRSRWYQHVQKLNETRSKAIEIEHSSSQELITYPYSIMPRRLWDLRSNRVVDFQMLHASQPNIRTPPPFWAVTHSWTSDMSPVSTPINQHQWPVPLPRNITLDDLRTELLALGAEYIWLDVICLRQKTEVNSLEQLRQQEWKLDVPTIGNIYRAAAKIVRYFNGLGIRFSNNGWDDPRHWLQRAWTLQEIATENTTINGGVPRDFYGRQVFLNSQGNVSGTLVKFRSANSPVLQLTEQVGSLYGCEIYELAREMAKRHASQPLDKLSGLFYLLRTTKLPCYNEELSCEDMWKQCFHLLPAERKAEILFDFPYRGSAKQWFPTWAQVLDWPPRDPEYAHMRSQSSQDLIRYIPGETSFIVTKLWTISGVVLHTTDYIGEYRAEINKAPYGFYLPYLSQKPIDIEDQPVFTLATMDLGHAYNWVVCKAVGKRVGRDVGLVGVAEVSVLKKVGVLRTDSCSDLLVGGENGASLLQKMNCLFV